MCDERGSWHGNPKEPSEVMSVGQHGVKAVRLSDRITSEKLIPRLGRLYTQDDDKERVNEQSGNTAKSKWRDSPFPC